MALTPFSRGKVPPPARPAPEPPAPKAGGDSEVDNKRGLPALFDKGIILQADRENLLKKGLEDGLNFFKDFNESRMRLAFDFFTEDMKKALFEVLFFLHVNDRAYSEVKFTGIEIEHIYGITREHEYQATANLYLEGAPHGVQGIEELPEIIRQPFFDYIQATFNTRPSASQVARTPVFVSISSLGSVGTVGHKPTSSDLDLQIQYELESFKLDTSPWDNERLTKALHAEINTWMQRIRAKQQLTAEALQNPAKRAELQKMARAQVEKAYPQLYKYLLEKQADYRQDLLSPKGPQLRQLILHEMMALIKRAEQRERGDFRQQEQLLKQRVLAVQDYVQKKFPKAEVYLFVADNESYRKGKHGTTLESKEASGSAYELLLTFEVLMPGIQFTPMIPTHFILPKMINDSVAFYERTIDYVRFGAVNVYQQWVNKLVNLGATPALDLRYMLAHGGAVYWESFKASSGNLAKALLNLFRIEMLHEPKYLITIIEMIKNPTAIDHFIQKPTPEEQSGKAPKDYGLRPWELIQMETTHPLLLKDPWWLKYKALKVAFGELSYLQTDERKRISRIIDLCFALHVKVSEVFAKAGDTRKFETHREKVLLDFLARAFPPGSAQRLFLEHVNIGETKAVIQFEDELKSLFKASLDRVLELQSRHGIPDESNQKEFEIWYHYYQKNFEPPKNMVRKSILHHLKVPRLRLQASFNKANNFWLFRSLQTESKLGKRFDTFSTLDHLPDEVDLLVARSFTYGLADCVLNSYYGYVNKGSLKEQKTTFEFDSANMKYGDNIDEKLAYLRPDNVMRLADQISEFFVYRTYHYMDCVKVPKHYLEIFFFLHMMKFGRLSILYRDNLTNWYLDEFDLPDLKQDAYALQADYKKTFRFKSLHQTLHKFFQERRINLADPKVKTAFWLNPNGAETTHGAGKVTVKENDIAASFREAIYKAHVPKTEKPEPEKTG